MVNTFITIFEHQTVKKEHKPNKMKAENLYRQMHGIATGLSLHTPNEMIAFAEAYAKQTEPSEDIGKVVLDINTDQAKQSNWVSDQDIEQYAWQEANEYSDNEFEQCDIHDNIVAGARWMRNKLLPEPPKKKQRRN